MKDEEKRLNFHRRNIYAKLRRSITLTSATVIPFVTLISKLVFFSFTAADDDEKKKNVPLFQLEPTGSLKKIETRLESVRRVKRATPRQKYKFKLQSVKRKETKQQTTTDDDVDQAKLSLDILIVTDYSVYQHFLRAANSDDKEAVDAIYKYYTGVLYEVAP